MTRPPAVRVVCVTYHPGAELAELAASLATATTADVELVLVDNGTDQSVAAEVAERHGATLLVPGRNLGYGAAANVGARGAQQPWVVVVNPDVVWHPGSLDLLLAAGERSGAGSVGPRLLKAAICSALPAVGSLLSGSAGKLNGQAEP